MSCWVHPPRLNIELAGLATGEFDQLVVTGDLDLNGNLRVSLIDSHVLGLDQQYLIADVAGNLTGKFFGLENEGDWVGSFGGFDLFITYQAGDGNDIALYTSAVPEPGGLGILFISSAVILVWRRRKKDSTSALRPGSVEQIAKRRNGCERRGAHIYSTRPSRVK